MWNLIRWVSPRTIKETFVPPQDYRYPFLDAENGDGLRAEAAAPRRPHLLAGRRLGGDGGAHPRHEGARPAAGRERRPRPRLLRPRLRPRHRRRRSTASPATARWSRARPRATRTRTARASTRPRSSPTRPPSARRSSRSSRSGGSSTAARATSATRSRATAAAPGGAASCPGSTPRASDPSIAYDRRHKAWLAVSLVFGGVGSKIAVNRSTDTRHWSAPVTAVSTSPQFGQDKEWIACDDWPQSPYYGNCYLSYSDTIGEEVVAQTSSDGGRTWSGIDLRAGLPGPRVDPRLLRAGRAAARAAERPRRDRLLRRGQDLGAALGRRRRDLDDASSGSRRPTTARTSACARRRCRPRRSAPTAAPTSPGPTAPSGSAARRTTSSTSRPPTGSPGAR